MDIPETVSPAGLRVRAELVRNGRSGWGTASESTARHLELAADRIEAAEEYIRLLTSNCAGERIDIYEAREQARLAYEKSA
jgi:hypothetical protein